MIKAIILGIVQGLTEFLPISSSGHLVLMKNILSMETPGVIWEVSLHLGTLFSILIFFRKRILSYLRKKTIKFIIVGSIPIALTGFLLKDKIESLFTTPVLTLIMLFVTGTILLFTVRAKENKRLNIKIALFIGIAQALALVPGLSRSGLTVATALFLGLEKKEAFEFSFILAIPALIGAFGLEFYGIKGNVETNCLHLITGAIIAFGAGIAALWFFYRLIKKSSLNYFTYYLWFVSLVGIGWILIYRFPFG